MKKTKVLRITAQTQENLRDAKRERFNAVTAIVIDALLLLASVMGLVTAVWFVATF